jgi:chorismate mutase
MIGSVSQKALDLNYDGLIIEVHPTPDKALSDAKQQITPDAYKDLKETLHVRHQSSDNELFKSKLEQLRNKINIIDHDIIDALSARRKVVEEIGMYKKENDVMVFQLERWNEIMRTRPNWAKSVGLDTELVEKIYKQIHEDSLKAQIQILNKELNGQTS